MIPLPCSKNSFTMINCFTSIVSPRDQSRTFARQDSNISRIFELLFLARRLQRTICVSHEMLPAKTKIGMPNI